MPSSLSRDKHVVGVGAAAAAAGGASASRLTARRRRVARADVTAR